MIYFHIWLKNNVDLIESLIYEIMKNLKESKTVGLRFEIIYPKTRVCKLI